MTDHASLPGLRRMLVADLARVLRQTAGGQPVTGLRRVMHLSLPAMQVAVLHRVAHLLHSRGHRRAAAVVAGVSLRLTGASIHPGSRIGPGLFMPHPARVAFCGSAGRDLFVLPGALVGPRETPLLDQPFPADAPRIGDGAVIGAHAGVQGPSAIGDGAMVGAGVCTLVDVPAGTVTMAVRRPARAAGRGARGDA